MIFLCSVVLLLFLPLSEPCRACAPPCERPAQSAASMGDDVQLISDLLPVLWLSTNSVQLAVPTGRDNQLISDLPPPLWLSTNAYS